MDTEYWADRWRTNMFIDLAIPAGSVTKFPAVALQQMLEAEIKKTVPDFLDRQGIPNYVACMCKVTTARALRPGVT